MQNQHITQVFNQVDSLPSLPATVAKVLAVTADPESSATDLMEAILPDQSMCATILKIANSAFFGMPREVATMDKAVTVLGFNEVHNIVLGKAVFNSFQKIGTGSQKTIQEFWAHSFSCALAAKILADDLGCSPSELFIAGLIHDIGKLVILMALPGEYLPMLELTGIHQLKCHQAESETFNINHEQVGFRLLTRWLFPERLLNSVGFHHHPQNDGNNSLYALIIQLSDILSILLHEQGIDSSKSLLSQVSTLLPGTKSLWKQHHLVIKEEQLEEWSQKLKISLEQDNGILQMFS
ncbi:MAG: HDOD domain-containing protein [Proteobacteria bacterium]|nr:HDOD domain-containing protein [Pseudomonadota bacterium]MBU1059721.1 HDOD domain-containing protein [Pseudomonadota bacterium]